MKTQLLILTISLISVLGNAQQNELTKRYKSQVISQVCLEIENRYVYPEKAKLITDHLQKLDKSNHFKSMNTMAEFSEALTAAIYEVGKDKHLIVEEKIFVDPQQEVDPMEAWIKSRLEERTFYRRYNANFKSITKLDGNISYLDLRGFYGLDFGRRFANAAIDMLATSDAIIIDLRNNSGGRGDMVDYLLSYFFDEAIITGVSKKRRGETFIERTNRTKPRLGERVISETPLFILTSKKTFSAAEAFSYPLQVYERATFIGETTRGGANAGDLIPLDESLQIFIPDVAGLPHPVSGTIFEGIGIVPDIEASSAEAYNVALEYAKKAAAEYKKKMDARARALLDSLNETVSNYDGSDDQVIVDAYLKCRSNDLVFESWELDALGHQLLDSESVKTSLAIFKTATILYPQYANSFNSYADALLQDSQIEAAISNYEKAVDIAAKNNEPDLQSYQKNLERAQNLRK